MRRWMATPLVFATAVGLASLAPPRVTAQPPGPIAETFRTADGVELHGLFHATLKNAATAPVVVFLYPPGPGQDMTKGDWGGLAKELNKEGYHVFQFDWRGHGKSTSIKDKNKFWGNIFLNRNNNFNAYIRGGNPNKNDISVKDLGTGVNRFLPAFLMDLAAVRYHLDAKNDNKELNTSSIYIVGAGDTAGLGLAWLTMEWNRPAIAPGVNLLGLGAIGYEYIPQPLRGIFDEAGADFGGAVWLTATRPSSMPGGTIQRWISNPVFAPKIRESNPMLFLYAEKDDRGAVNGKRHSEFFFNEVLIADPRRAKAARLDVPEQTFIREVKGAEQLQGVKLLGQNATLKTEDTIVLYFRSLQKVRQRLASKSREYKSPYYVDLRTFGLNP